MSSRTRSSCFAAASARAAFSRRHACHGPVEEERLGPPELEHRRRHRLEEPAVVRDEDDRRVERRQLALEPLEALDVEVVRRLVEQQQVGVAGERARRARRASAPRPRTCRAAGRGRRRRSRGRGRSTPRGRARPSRPRARGAPAPRCSGAASRGRGRPPAIACSSRRSSSSIATRSPAPESEYSRSVRPAAARRALVVQRDARVLRERELAALERGLARDRPEQRRLAGAVRACEREPVAAAQPERDPVEERVARELLAQPGCDQDGHSRKGADECATDRQRTVDVVTARNG